ncbi:MAG: AMP-binding protein [Alphaproteobacteria bacterium]|nr:AMP-binding protein [Alphaproteobacteria bacterium]
MDLGLNLPQDRIDAFVKAGVWIDRTIFDYLDAALASGADRPAITSYNGETGQKTALSYAELDRLSRRLALALIDLGVAPGDVVSLQLPNWWQFNAMHLACARIGAITNPLMPIFRGRELSYMLGFAESKVVIAPHSFRGFAYKPMIEAIRGDLPNLTHAFYIDGEGADDFATALLSEPREQRADADAVLAALRPGPNTVNEVIYTSGTTGQPKGVMHTANSTLGHLSSWIKLLRLSGEDKVFMASPLAHQTGFLYAILQPIMLGAEVVLLDRWDAPVGVELIQKHGCTFTMGATPFLSDIVEMPNVENFDLSKLRIFASAGAPIPPALVQKAAANFSFKVLSGWGMTECACSTICLLDDPAEKAWTSDGYPLPHTEVTVHRLDGSPAPRGEEGVLKVRGQPMFVGYLKKPELHGRDADGWFDTGDQAFIHPDGYIRITGRAKDIIIRGGENVPVVEVEDVIYRHPLVAEVAVVGIPDDRLGERGCAFVTLQPGGNLDLAALIHYLDELGTAKQYWPEHLEVVDEMPRTPSGKIQKFKLREMAKAFSR